MFLEAGTSVGNACYVINIRSAV